MTWGNPHRKNWSIPSDASVVEETDSWKIYHSPSEGRLYISGYIRAITMRRPCRWKPQTSAASWQS